MQIAPSVTHQLIPDRFLDNRSVDSLADSLHRLYEPVIKRVGVGEMLYQGVSGVVWEVAITPDNISWHVTTPRTWGSYVKTQLSSCWPKSAVNETDFEWTFGENTTGAIMHLRHHHFLSLSTDRRELAPLPTLCEVSRALSPPDRALLQIVMIPASPDWHFGVEEAMERFNKGEMPARTSMSGKRMIKSVFLFGARAGAEILATVAGLITDEETEPLYIEDPDHYAMIRHGGLSQSTLTKGREEAFDVTVRLVASSDEPGKRRTILRSLASAMRTTNGDNEWVVKEASSEKFLRLVEERRPPVAKMNPDLLSVSEVSRLLQLPPWSLQEEYPVANINSRELSVPASMTRGGLALGSITQKGESTPVYWPVRNHDELCLPRVAIGGMGTGKSLGYGAGFAADAIRAGHSVFVVDVTDGDMSDTIRDSLPADFPGDHLIDLDFANTEYPIPINWGESAHMSQRQIATRLSSHLVTFLARYSDEMGPRTQRYVKAAGQAVFSDPDSTLLEVLLMILSKKFRSEQLKKVKDPRLLAMWKDFDSMTQGMRSMVTAPILNRLDLLMGNEYTANCILQKPKNQRGMKIDFRKWADGDSHPYCVLLRVTKSILWEQATDAIVTYLLSKLWLAILTRIDQPISARKPAFLIMDEPHQYLGSAKGGTGSTWASMITESRKWRLGLVFLFHDWAQLPGSLARLIRGVGPHYTLYSTSKETYTGLAEEITPFTVEEALETPTHYAINAVRADNSYHRFLAKMATPPLNKGKSWRHERVDRSDRTRMCSRIFGRHVDVVEESIYQRERMLHEGIKR